MKKMGDITDTADKNGEFTDGNVAAGIPPTQLMSAWFNSVQREILNVLSKAGIPQSATKENQLADAITKMIADYSQPKGSYITTSIMTMGLNKKLDKSNVSQQLTNDVNKVPSLDLLAKELGKKQSAGSYVPSSRKINGKPLTSDMSLNAIDVGAYSTNQTDNKFQLKNTAGKEERGWWKCSHTGIIYQWGKWKNPYKKSDIGGREGIPIAVNLTENFPISFPTMCTVVIPTVTNSDTRDNIYSPRMAIHSFSKTQFIFQVGERWSVVQNANIYWFAVGY